MGDRCYVEVYVHREDLGRFVALVPELGEVSDYSDLEEFPHLVYTERDEVNYGACHGRAEAAMAGLRFHGSQGSGCEYDACVFAAYGGRQYEVEESRSGFVIRIDPETLEICAQDVENMRGYNAALAAVKEGKWCARHIDK